MFSLEHFLGYFFIGRDHASNIAQSPQKIKKNKLFLKREA